MIIYSLVWQVFSCSIPLAEQAYPTRSSIDQNERDYLPSLSGALGIRNLAVLADMSLEPRWLRDQRLDIFPFRSSSSTSPHLHGF